MLHKKLELGQDFTPVSLLFCTGIPVIHSGTDYCYFSFLYETDFPKNFKRVKPKRSYFKCPLICLFHVVYVFI